MVSLFAGTSFGRCRPGVPVRLAAPWTPTPRAHRAGGALTSTYRPLTPRVASQAPPLAFPDGGQLGDPPPLAERRVPVDLRDQGLQRGLR